MDALLENHGSIILLRPVSARADEWLRTRLEPDAQFCILPRPGFRWTA